MCVCVYISHCILYFNSNSAPGCDAVKIFVSITGVKNKSERVLPLNWQTNRLLLYRSVSKTIRQNPLTLSSKFSKFTVCELQQASCINSTQISLSDIYSCTIMTRYYYWTRLAVDQAFTRCHRFPWTLSSCDITTGALRQVSATNITKCHAWEPSTPTASAPWLGTVNKDVSWANAGSPHLHPI